jgi:hypothetical protein
VVQRSTFSGIYMPVLKKIFRLIAVGWYRGERKKEEFSVFWKGTQISYSYIVTDTTNGSVKIYVL